MNATSLFPYYEAVARFCPRSQLRAAAQRLSERYRFGAQSKRLQGIAEHCAYITCRMPATFAACRKALQRVKEVLPSFCPHTMIDMGSGPGGAIVAAHDVFPSIVSAVGFEQNVEFEPFFSLLFSQSCVSSVTAQFYHCDMRSIPHHSPKVDMAIASYVFGESSHSMWPLWMRELSRGARVLLIVEPGTPDGYQCLMECRRLAIAMHGTIVAPCPHAGPCPQEGSQRWCHESVRLCRTSLHRVLKGGDLGYEDEKFSYLAIVFDPTLIAEMPQYRILHVPQHRHGHSHCVVCSSDGTVYKKTFSKKIPSEYKEAREATWGDRMGCVQKGGLSGIDS